MKRRPTKKVAHLRIHVKRRAQERFGWDMTSAEVDSISRAIQTNAKHAVFFGKQSNTVSLWLVTVRDQVVGTAYDNARHSIRTLMPKEWLLDGDGRQEETD